MQAAALQDRQQVQHFKVKRESVQLGRACAERYYGSRVRRAQVDKIVLIVSELLTNVVRHTGLPETAFMTLICHEPDDQGNARFEVSDACDQLPVRRELDLAAVLEELTPEALDNMSLQELEVGGQGLRLFDGLCSHWESRRLPQGGKTVICTVGRAE
jgi:anti-sigma regulatory factor (Ser/Thr protein kinase)